MTATKHKRILQLCIAIGAMLGVAAAQADTASPNKPNILFAFADDWGYGHAGAFGDTILKGSVLKGVSS
jgi:N-sulfoglucosamine sulfohydrolase